MNLELVWGRKTGYEFQQKSKKKNQPIHQSMRKIKKTGHKVYYLMCSNHIVFKLLI